MARIPKAERALRKRKIATLVRQGLSFTEIQQTCEKQLHWRMPRSNLSRYLAQIAQAHRDALAAEHLDHVALQLARYNDLYQQASAKGDRHEARLILRDIDALLGLKAPQKRIISGNAEGAPVRLEAVQALRQMSQAERDEYRRMMARVEELGTAAKPPTLQIGPPSEEEIDD
jgi:hypothetical protein